MNLKTGIIFILGGFIIGAFGSSIFLMAVKHFKGRPKNFK